MKLSFEDNHSRAQIRTVFPGSPLHLGAFMFFHLLISVPGCRGLASTELLLIKVRTWELNKYK